MTNLPYTTAKRRARRRQLIAGLVIVLGCIIFVGISYHDKTPITATNPLAVSTPLPSPAPTPLPSAPSTWQAYTNTYGFTFEYPASWGVDDATLNQYYTLHQAFLSYGNQLTVYSTSAAESDPTIGPSLTITVASQTDEQSLLRTTFTSSKEWLLKSSTGLPPGAIVSNTVINGEPAVRLSGLTVVLGEYEAVYFLDTTNSETVRFDYYYTNPTDLQTLDAIVGSFRFN